jgi:hypothetical protein
MSASLGHGKILPFWNVASSDGLHKGSGENRTKISLLYSVVVGLCSVPKEVGNLSHSTNANDAFDGQIGLVGKMASEIVGRELFSGASGAVSGLCCG